ncbi:hypothetical protein Daus18300_010148 [Diaporthe australafricana]|uniref:Uncharacterized protein n=1 Tax=Diaporthe australafricana TaxID=127596 RepID=A0ABR3WBK8_9PEZI
MQQPGSSKLNSSKMAKVTKLFKKASAKLDQKLEKLKSRMSKPQAVDQQNEKLAITAGPEAVDDKLATEVKTSEQNDKTAKREARKAKWAATRLSLKRFMKKTGKGIAITGVVVLGVVFGPVVLILELTFRLIALVIQLLMELLGIIVAPICAEIKNALGFHSMAFGAVVVH